MSIKINLKLNVRDLHQNTVHLISTQSLITTCEMFFHAKPYSDGKVINRQRSESFPENL